MATAPSSSSVQRSHSRASLWLAAILAFALIEVIVHFSIRWSVPTYQQWEEAASYVREHSRNKDAIVVAPAWADPILRWVLGDKISLSVAGHSDLAAYDRLWALSIRGEYPKQAPPKAAELLLRFGRVTVQRWDLKKSRVVYDLVEHIAEARVTSMHRGNLSDCPWSRLTPQGSGGLGKGIIVPKDRFVCDRNQPWLWVAPVVLEDLDLKARYCVWHHPAGPRPIRVTYTNIPLGEYLVLYGGLYYEHERDLNKGPVQVEVFIDQDKAGQMVHRDGDGWKRLVVPTQKKGSDRLTGDVHIEVTAPNPHQRTFCWAATTRRELNNRPER